MIRDELYYYISGINNSTDFVSRYIHVAFFRDGIGSVPKYAN
jgi:hypothetical protein